MTDQPVQHSVRTLAVHAGEPLHDDMATAGSCASTPDICMSTTFVVKEPVSFSANNIQPDTPVVYTRWANPTITQLEVRLAALEQAEACVAFSSGMAASSAVLLGLLSQGDHLICSNTNYPGTAELIRGTLPRFGISVSPVDTSSVEAISRAIQPNTRMIWAESPSNPLLKLTDIRVVSALARQHQILFAIDSTFATPIATRPLTLGADLVVHSLTKYLGGHGDALGGAVLGSQALLGPLRAEGLIHYGGAISPFNAWLIMRGIATLPIRMQAHQQSALELAAWLAEQSAVRTVLYPGLASHPQHELASRQMDNYSGMISFTTDDPPAVAQRMMNDLKVIHYAVSLGHQRSLIFLLDSADLLDSSYRLTGEEREQYLQTAGNGIFRFSVGLEDPVDLVDDLKRVL